MVDCENSLPDSGGLVKRNTMAVKEQTYTPLERYEMIKKKSAEKWKVNTYTANEFEFMKSVLKQRRK